MGKTWDVVVIGLGSAALQLAYLVRNDLNWKSKRILFIDPTPSVTKSWCFWHAGPHPMDAFVSHKWAKFEFASHQFNKSELPGLYSYRYINSSDMYNWFHTKALTDNSNWKYVQAKVLDCRLAGKEWEIKTDTGDLTGNVIYDSRLASIDLKHPLIYQHFRGLLIQTDAPMFDPGKATFMDFSTTADQAFPTFVYVLPFSERSALVETTVFSGQLCDDSFYDSITQQYIASKFPGTHYQVVGHEKGAIPMAFVQYEKSSLPGYIKIGGASGQIKSTTGYAFNRINRQLRAHLGLSGSGLDSGKKRFKFYDSLLLSIINDEPQKIAGIFSQLFQRNEMEQILKFLDEDSRLPEEIKIFATLPWGPFLRALGKKWR